MKTQFIRPASLQVFRDPFPYFMAMSTLDWETIESSLMWLASEAHWKLVEADFYEQHELNWTEGQLPVSVACMTAPEFLVAMRSEVGRVFQRTFVDRVDWSVHKLQVGQRIRIHNDLHKTGESHRVILHLNDRWCISQGGLLMLFNSSNPSDVHRVLMPVAGSVVGFEISENSNHAVSLVLDGERFAIVYSLYSNDEC